jgi:hypothetical protein
MYTCLGRTALETAASELAELRPFASQLEETLARERADAACLQVAALARIAELEEQVQCCQFSVRWICNVCFLAGLRY